ncbi:MAG TPA: hypothetical protein QGG47_00780 [Acidobacteriota bacterium]|nr:hypothetical protein [Acidobacteriota bacterium]
MTDSLQARAEQHLQLIRAAMERAATFTALPGWGGVIMGVVGLLGALAAARATDPRQWVLVWFLAAGVAVPVGALTMWRKASRAEPGSTSTRAPRVCSLAAWQRRLLPAPSSRWH